MSTKILAVGSVTGAYSSLVGKVKAIDAKHGKFEVLLCLGDFFAPPESEDSELDDLLSDKIAFPIPTYIVQGPHPIPPKALEKCSRNAGELCSNVFLLDKSGVITTSQKLTIASFGGSHDPETFASGSAPLDASEASFNTHNLSSFLSSSRLPSTSTSTPSGSGPAPGSLAAIKSAVSTAQIDILLTNQWPTSITRLSKTTPANIDSASFAPPLDQVVQACRPRYHFTCSGGTPPVFWEREPYSWDDTLVSRFISLGSFGASLDPSSKKQRWFYAFSIAPQNASSPPAAKPANATASPFVVPGRSNGSGSKRQGDNEEGGNYIFGDVQAKKPRLGDQKAAYKKHQTGEKSEKPPDGYKCRICQSSEHFIRDCPEKNATGDTGGKKPPSGYVCRACGSEGHFIQDCPTVKERGERGPRGVRAEIPPQECWFCLSNPQVTKHLIVSIGTEVYLTLPKGQLPPTSSSTASPTSVPGGGHVLLIPIAHHPTLSATRSASPSTLTELQAYKSALTSFYSRYNCSPVFFEVSRSTGRGAGGHAHIQAVPVPTAREGEVEGAFRAYGGMQIVWEKEPESALESAMSEGSSYFRADLPGGGMMVHLLKPQRPFNLQFGREALAHFLELPDRADWKACSQTEDEEVADANAFKEAFAEFEPSE